MASISLEISPARRVCIDGGWGRAVHGVGYVQHAHAEHAEQPDLLHARHLQLHENGHGYDERRDLAGDVDERAGHEDAGAVDAVTIGDVEVPRHGDGRAGEHHERDYADRVDGEQDPQRVDRQAEPAHRREPVVEEEDGQFRKELAECKERGPDDDELLTWWLGFGLFSGFGMLRDTGMMAYDVVFIESFNGHLPGMKALYFSCPHVCKVR